MANRINNPKLATAVAAVVGLGLSATANAVVVVGGDNGWEVSFDGNINAFYVFSNNDAGWNNLGLGAPDPTVPGNNRRGFAENTREDISRVNSGFIPAFFSFNVKSPTWNGMTTTGRFSFAPAINNSTSKNQFYGTPLAAVGAGNVLGGNGLQGSNIDMREVVVNVESGWGTVSFGRTLSLFGRQAVLNDMTLFGVGVANQDSAGVAAGRSGRGYLYPNFNARFSYKTPMLMGFQAELGLYDPSHEELNRGAGLFGGGGSEVLNQTDKPRLEGELTYTATIGDATFKGWFDGLWQEIKTSGQNTFTQESVDVHGWGVGGTAGMMGFNLTGYYYDGEGLGRSLQFMGGTACAGIVNNTLECEAASNNGYYVQGTYTFFGKTKLGVSYGESNQDAFKKNVVLSGATRNQDVSLSMWTVGVYHDINSWLKLIAEYSNAKNDFSRNAADPTTYSGKTESNTFSVGTYFVW